MFLIAFGIVIVTPLRLESKLLSLKVVLGISLQPN